MKGRIRKGVGSFYTVEDAQGRSYTCKARGKFRREGLTPVPGDYVEFLAEGEDRGRIENILPRKNVLLRPAVANIDKLLIVLSLSSPAPDLMLADKLLLQCEAGGIQPVLLLNKSDEARENTAAAIEAEYARCGYAIHRLSAAQGMGIGLLEAEIRGCTCCFAGQSAVGKSSLLNCIFPTLHAKTGELSKKTERGRHTTRHAELLPVFGGAVVDTPGFSLLELPDMEPQALSQYYAEMRSFIEDCRFSACLHAQEPDCAVKAALGEGKIAQPRYERYLILLEECKEKRKHRYD